MNINELNIKLIKLRHRDIEDFDLSAVHIDGTPLFRMGSIARNKMPQLKGFPIEGSIATMIPQDKNGKVDVTQPFIEWIKRVRGAQVLMRKVSPAELKGSQCEIVASKVAEKIPKLMANDAHKKFKHSYLTSSDGTLLDGHHGWASVRLWELLTGNETSINTIQIMMHTDELIEAAQQFTATVGVAHKEGV